MSGEKKSNRKFRSLKMESLEKRELMAADVRIENRVLLIKGTDASEKVLVDISQGNTRVYINNKTMLVRPTSEYSSVDAKMYGGKDDVTIRLNTHPHLRKVDVDMGSGVSENLRIQVGRADEVNVNAGASINTDVTLQSLHGANVDKVFVNFGDDNGKDSLIIHNWNIGSLESNMGGGNDYFKVSSTSIGLAAVNLGSGDDNFELWTKNSTIRNGFVDGGVGSDLFENVGKFSPGGVAVRNFEKVR